MENQGGHGIKLTIHGQASAIEGLRVSAKIWGISTLAIDIITTFSTIVYLYYVRKNLGTGHGAFMMVWQVMWASATPPLILMVISIVGGSTTSNVPRLLAGALSTAMSGKFFVLSLMINLVGYDILISNSVMFITWSRLTDKSIFGNNLSGIEATLPVLP
ncbi:unnamed protein product [Rhizoctonia solani]|uniref:Uncharacterized protein n=1 Tax=Rhizoctonia solani TaxID=456999 RepID=A0A8H3D6W8_9AGAM|nr:unnamed protein product [Rhizoctonia solani]